MDQLYAKPARLVGPPRLPIHVKQSIVNFELKFRTLLQKSRQFYHLIFILCPNFEKQELE